MVDLILRVGYAGIPIGEIKIVPIVDVPSVEASLILYIQDLFNLIIFTFLSLSSRNFTNKVHRLLLSQNELVKFLTKRLDLLLGLIIRRRWSSN